MQLIVDKNLEVGQKVFFDNQEYIIVKNGIVYNPKNNKKSVTVVKANFKTEMLFLLKDNNETN